ncbi:hypothetical protein ABIF36_008083 [Bradyrhizobium japonicum]
MRIFACQHKTRETVWIPELMKHANAAKRIKQTLIATPDPAKDAAHLARLIDREPKTEADGAVTVPSGGDRADFVYLTLDQLGKRYPGVPLAGLSERGGAALVLVSGDLAATEKALGTAALRSGPAIVVPPAKANGTLLAFVAG